MPPKNLLTLAGALAALALLISMPFAGLVSAEPTEVGAPTQPTPPYSFSKSFGLDLRATMPKGTTYYVVSGDLIDITKGKHDVWYGGWFGTKYERYIKIDTVKITANNAPPASWYIDWDSDGITGRAPFLPYHGFQVSWSLRYSDHGSGKHVTEDSGTFTIMVRGPVLVKLLVDGQADYRAGRDAVTLPHLPKPGMTHLGWQRGSNTYGPGATYTAPSTSASTFHELIAVYSTDYHTITFDSAGGSSVPPRQIAANSPYGSLPIPTRDGYTFDGWYHGAIRVTPTDVPTSDVTLTASWIADEGLGEYVITLIPGPVPLDSIVTDAGTLTLVDGSVTVYGGTILMEPDLARDRHIVHRWIDSQGNTYDWATPVTRDLTLTADWREHYTVAVEGNHVTVTISPTLPGDYTVHRVDWGDQTINDDSSHTYAVPGNYSITVSSGRHSVWTSSSTVVTITEMTDMGYRTVYYDTGGGNHIPPQTVEYGTIATAPADPSRTGYEFIGWYNAGVRWDWSTPITADVTLTAGWLPITPGGDDNGDDSASGPTVTASMIAIGLTVVMALLALVTRHPAAIGLTVIMAVVTIALEVIA